MALPNITPIVYTARAPQQPQQTDSFADLLRTLSMLQTLQYRAQRNAAGPGTGMPKVEGDYMLMPDGNMKFIPGATVEMRKQNLATMRDMELNQMLQSDELLQSKLASLERDANTMSYGKQEELLEGARSDIRRIAELNKVDPNELIKRALRPYEQKLSKLASDIARDDGLNAIMDSAKIAGSRAWNAIKQIGEMNDSAGKVALGEDQNAYAQKVTEQNAYLRDQQLRAQEGQGVFERMGGPTGSALTNIATGAVEQTAQYLPAIGAQMIPIPGVGPALGSAWLALQGVQGQSERIAGTDLSPEAKVQAMDDAAEQSALVGAISGMPFGMGKLARGASHFLRGAGPVDYTRTFRNYLTKDLPITAAENLVGDTIDTVGQNIIFDRATGINTDVTEGLGETVVNSLGGSIPMAVLPWWMRPRAASKTSTPPAAQTPTAQPAEPTQPVAPTEMTNVYRATPGKASKKKATKEFITAVSPEEAAAVRQSAAFTSLWADVRSPAKADYDAVETAVLKYLNEGGEYRHLLNILEGGDPNFWKQADRPNTSILTTEDLALSKRGRTFLDKIITEISTEEGLANAQERYRARSGVTPAATPVAESGTEGPAGAGDANPAGNSGMASPEPAPLESTADIPAQEPVAGDRAAEVGGTGGPALQGQRAPETLEVPAPAEGGTPDAGTDAGRYPEGARAAGGEAGEGAGGAVGEGVGGQRDAEPSADAGAVFESFGPSIESIRDAQAVADSGIPLNRVLDPADFERPAADPVPDTPSPAKNRVKAKEFELPRIPTVSTEIRTRGGIMGQVGAAVEALGNQPKDVKFYESLVKNQDKQRNALRSLIHAKLLDKGVAGVKKLPHLTKARNELARYGAVPEMIPDIKGFEGKFALYRKAFADPNDANPVDLYESLLDKQAAQERTLNADGCKTI